MEVCVDCVASARNAELGGAARLELCSALSEGGLTPSVGLLQVVKSLVRIPVFVMVRPRRGIDFVYSDEEIDLMEVDIISLKLAGADGFVFGALTLGRRVNEDVCMRLLRAAVPLPCTFHRAFDMTQDPMKELETIISLGFQRILTSGQEKNACSGVKVLRDLINQSQGRISIMPGAGITEINLEFILQETGAKEFHASARTPVEIVDVQSCENLSMGASDKDCILLITNIQDVENMVKISERVWMNKNTEQL